MNILNVIAGALVGGSLVLIQCGAAHLSDRRMCYFGLAAVLFRHLRSTLMTRPLQREALQFLTETHMKWPQPRRKITLSLLTSIM